MAWLTAIMKASLKNPAATYASYYDWEVRLNGKPGFKSYIDVCYLYELVRAVRRVVEGDKLGGIIEID